MMLNTWTTKVYILIKPPFSSLHISPPYRYRRQQLLILVRRLTYLVCTLGLPNKEQQNCSFDLEAMYLIRFSHLVSLETIHWGYDGIRGAYKACIRGLDQGFTTGLFQMSKQAAPSDLLVYRSTSIMPKTEYESNKPAVPFINNSYIVSDPYTDALSIESQEKKVITPDPTSKSAPDSHDYS
jgi:hypothetical protein